MATNENAQATLDHFGTVVLNVVKMNRPWRPEDIKHIGDYIKTSNMSHDIQKVVLYAVTDAYCAAMEKPLKNAVEKEGQYVQSSTF